MQSHHLHNGLLRREVKVLVVGAGGTGSQILTGLVQLHQAMTALGHPAGLHVTVIDDDVVSSANIGRQLFWPADVGQHKASVLINRINLGFGLRWNAEIGRVTGDRLEADLVIGCVDNRKARKAIVDGLSQSYKPCYYLDIGNSVDSGQIILGEVGGSGLATATRLPHAGDLFPELIDPTLDDSDDVPSCSLADALSKQALFINRGVSQFALNLLWELFRFGKIDYHGVFLNLKSARTSPLAIDPAAWERFGYRIDDIAEKAAA